MEPVFLSREQLDEAHGVSLERYGGTAGLRSEDSLESALHAPENDYLYANADLFGIAAAYAFHIAQAQAFLDGNKRAAVVAALIFLDGNGVETGGVDSYQLHGNLAAIAERRMTKAELAGRFRELFGR